MVVIKEFMDVFFEEIMGLPPKRERKFSIYPILEESLVNGIA